MIKRSFIVIVLMITLFSCGTEEPSLEQLLLGKWRCEVTNGDWDELNFSSITDLTWTFYDASSGVTEKDEYTYVIDENTVFLTNTRDQSKSAHSYSINNNELTFQFFNGSDYLYYKK